MREKKLLLLVPFLIVFFSFLPSGSVLANQYGITVGATAGNSQSVIVYIPAGTYHVYSSIEYYLGSMGAASCSSEILELSLGYSNVNPYILESVVTINQSKDYNFTVFVSGSEITGYYANFAIVLTDLDVALLTKTSVIGNAPFNLEFIILGILCISVGLSIMRRKQNKN